MLKEGEYRSNNNSIFNIYALCFNIYKGCFQSSKNRTSYKSMDKRHPLKSFSKTKKNCFAMEEVCLVKWKPYCKTKI